MNLATLPARPFTEDHPGFDIDYRVEGVELRRYAPMVVAQTHVEGPAAQAGNQAFPILAGYLFGRNSQGARLSMTSPVMQCAAAGGFDVQFPLPRGTPLSGAPQPSDPRISLREIATRRVAAIACSGRWSDAGDAMHLQRLIATLQAASLRWVGEPIQARYNAPYTLWILRRNEIWLVLP